VLRGSGLRRVVRAGRWVLVVLTAWASALAANQIIFPDPGAGAGSEVERRATPDRVRGASSQLDPSIILERNLFGSAPVAEVASSDRAGRGFDNSLKLRGTAFSEGRAFAVFENGDGAQEVFIVGERVFEGARVHSIEPEAAVLAAGGRRRRYEIEEEETEEEDGREGNGGGRKRDAAPTGPTGGIRATSPGNYVVDRREVDFAIENLNYVITQARAVPVLRDGKATGYKLFNIRPGSLFERLGLRNGDVVQRINGNELDNPGKAVGLLDEIQSMEEIRMDFLRGGKPLTFEYAVR
jgi:general secretion pathway protein C